MIATVLTILLIAYTLGVLSLAWNVWRTITLVNEDAAIHPDTRIPTPPPSIDIVVPVKDEAAHIAATIHAMLDQKYPGAVIHVVNDRSTDNTAAVIQSIQSEHPAVRRLDVTALPTGLYGKPHALHLLAPQLSADILLFVDSDMRLKPGCLAAVVNHMNAGKLDWLAAIGEPDVAMFWERLLLPIFGAMAYAWHDPRKINDPNCPDAIGCGFTAVRREKYFEIGGHESVMDRYDEDSAILRRAKSFGHRVNYALAPSLYWVRFYGDLNRTIRGFTRTIVGGLKTQWRIAVSIMALHFVSHLPLILLTLIPSLLAAGVTVPSWPYWLTVAAAHLVLSNTLAALVFKAAKQPVSIALLHPIGALIAIWTCIRAARDLDSKKAITWRGTSYQSS